MKSFFFNVMKRVKCKGGSVNLQYDLHYGYTVSKLVFLRYQKCFFLISWSSGSRIYFIIFNNKWKKKKSPTYTSDACCTLYVAFVPNKSFKSIQDVISNCVAQTLRDLEPLELTALKTSFTICRVLNVLSSYLSYLEVISSIYFK